MMVPAPGLFSIITDAPRSFAISCARVRAITSVPPPGAKGTTILTIRSGYTAKAASFESADSNANATSADKATVGLEIQGNDMRRPLRAEVLKQESQIGGSDHPRHNGNLSQHHGEPPAHRQRARKHDGKFDERRE